ncbi:MAG: CoA transferase [Lautropia sp.]
MLQALRVIELSAFIAAPYAGLLLAQMGADVIRVDPPGGGPDIRRWPLSDAGVSMYWAGLNKGKRSVTIDTRKPEGRELVAALVADPHPGGGIMLTNLAARHELSWDALRARRADLIALQIKGHHDNKTALDYTVNSAVGVPLATGNADPRHPVNNMLPAWDALAGASAAMSIVAAQMKRLQTGAGELIQLALSDVGYAFVSHIGATAEAELQRQSRPAIGNHIYAALGHDLGTADGRRVMFAVLTPSQWKGLLAATGLGEAVGAVERAMQLDFATDDGRYAAREILVALFDGWTRQRTLAQVREAFDANGVCWGPYQDFVQLVDEDPRFTEANPMIRAIDQPGVGRIRAAGLPMQFASDPDRRVAPAPRLGEHTEAVLTGVLGLSGGAFGRLVDAKVVAP